VAISAKFQADFESFHAEAQKAEGELENLAKGAGTVEQSLNKMVTAAPGMGTLAANTGTLSQAQGRAASSTQLLHTSLQRFDNVLSSVGVSIGPATRGSVSSPKRLGSLSANLGRCRRRAWWSAPRLAAGKSGAGSPACSDSMMRSRI
jgi:hypothetical protein